MKRLTWVAKGFLSGLVALSVGSCGSPDPQARCEANPDEPGCARISDDRSAKIIAGREAQAGDEVSRSTVAVVYNDQLYATENKTCSGTLVDKRVVLTAAHCFEYGKDCRVIFGLKVSGPGVVAAIEGKCVSHPEYGPSHDIAMVYLDQDAPDGYQPVPWLTASDQLQVNQEIVLAGYGRNVGRTGPGADGDRGTLRFTEQLIASLGGPAKKTFEYTNSNSQTPNGQCSGDSGGPAYVRRPDGGLSLAGVIVSGDLYCREGGTQTDVRYYSDWIVKTRASLASAGAAVLRDGKCYSYCPNGASDDPDGDGWGWADKQSCIVKGSSQDTILDFCYRPEFV